VVRARSQRDRPKRPAREIRLFARTGLRVLTEQLDGIAWALEKPAFFIPIF
jgi:hypothetical protein